MILEKVTKDLPVKLIEHELVERGQQLADAYDRLKEHSDHEAQVKQGLKGTRAEIENLINRLVSIIRARQEPRPVEVEIIANWDKGTATYYRMDSGEVVQERSLTLAEKNKRQGELFPNGEEEREEEPEAEDESESEGE